MNATTATHAKGRRKSQTEIYESVTQQIVEHLERGVKPWNQPWSSGHAAGPVTRPLRHNGERYRGINVLMLWMTAGEQGYDCPLWLTFKQAQQLGGHVKRGEKGAPVVYASSFRKTETDDSGEDTTREIPFLKQYVVFNASQCEGLPERFQETIEPLQTDLEPCEAVAEFVKHTGAIVQEGGSRAFYRMSEDIIGMPAIDRFHDAESHAATLAHELTHWTRHPSRLDRSFDQKRFADDGYAMEELVAELSSAYLCADLQITPEVREDHAGYLKCWLDVLKADSKAIFTAAAYAAKAVDYLHGLQPQVATAVRA
ncbi:MAG: zincin-like metallopeptidase domain-containing protein [Fuerstiella sp.]